MLPRFVIVMAGDTVHRDFGAQENKICHCFHCFAVYLPWSDGTRCHDLRFLMLSFKAAFSLSSFTFIKRLFNSSSLSAIRVVSFAYLRLLIFCCCCWVASVVSNSVRPHRWQPMRLPHTWDFPGKNTGVGCHCLLRIDTQTHTKWNLIDISCVYQNQLKTDDRSKGKNLKLWTLTRISKIIKTEIKCMLKMWSNWTSHTLLMRMWNSVTTLENSLAVLQQVKHNITSIWSPILWPSHSTPRYFCKRHQST